eukprot:4693553-Karenia_brevis.AAC.1
MPAVARKGPATPRIPAVHVASFGLENYQKKWRRIGDFKHISQTSLNDLMQSDRVNKDARKVDLHDTDTIKIIQRRFLEEFP